MVKSKSPDIFMVVFISEPSFRSLANPRPTRYVIHLAAPLQFSRSISMNPA
jgi:hypothetical protein